MSAQLTRGSNRIPAAAFANNPYEIPRNAVTNSIAASLTQGGASPNNHLFAIHQLPRTSNGLAPLRTGSAAGSNPIAIPAGSPLPLSPSSSKQRLTLVQSQALSAQQNALQRAQGLDPNSPLAHDGQLGAASGSSPSGLFKRSKNLDQRLADYLRPKSVAGGRRNLGSPSNISVNLLPHPKSPLGSLNSPGEKGFHTRTEAQDAAAAAEKEKQRAEREASQNQENDGEEKEETHGAEEGPSPKKGGKKTAFAAAAAAIEAAASEGQKKKKGEDEDEGGEANAPASMNLKAVLRAQKAAERAEQEALEKEKESKKPWTGLTWSDIVVAKTFLQAQAKAKADKAASAAGGAAELKLPSAGKNAAHANLSSSLALQVAQQWISSAAAKNQKKQFNVYSLTEFQRSEYKMANEQAKWLNFYPKEELHRKDASMIPSEIKKSSSKSRMMNLCKGEILQQTLPGTSGGALLYNTYVSCNSQYGYVRYLGRVPWANGVWVGMELVEKHPYTGIGGGSGPWVDFYHEQSAIGMQMLDDATSAAGAANSYLANLDNSGGEEKGKGPGGKKRKPAAEKPDANARNAADQMTQSGTSAPQAQMVVNTAIPRPLVLAAMLPPTKSSGASGAADAGAGARGRAGSEIAGAAGNPNDQYQPLSASIFPFLDVVAFLREGLASCFELGDVDTSLVYFAPVESVKRVAQKQKIDSKTLLAHKEQQTNPFSDVDELACNTPKKHEGTVEMLSRYLTVSDREILDGERNKARAIFRWICHNIRYDPNSSIKPADVISIIRHRKATAEGFSMLFHALAAAGGLQCLRIRGVEKQLNHRTEQVVRNKHAWNAVKIEGEWTFIDCVFSCGQYVEGSSGGVQASQSSGHQGSFQQMFSDAYFCTPPSLFILEHYPTDAFGDNYTKVLPQEYNNLQLLRSMVSASEFEKGLIPGRAFVEYHMRAARKRKSKTNRGTLLSAVTNAKHLNIFPCVLLSLAFTYAVECKQPSYQIEITAPAFILFDVELTLKSHVVDLSQW
jgi:hypothetical protein